LRFNEAAWPLFSLAKARDGGYLTPIWRIGITLRRYRGANRCFGPLGCWAGVIFIARKFLAPTAEQIFFAMFLIMIAAFYLAFAAYFRAEQASSTVPEPV
jgi:hypothetical protein